MPLASGDRLGPYEILAPLGAGGMGEVFKATDTRLDRTVAVKTSKTEFSERFEREARAISALNHPHICQLYDVGPNYLVMEYVEGAPLKGPLPLEKALEYAGQIASALDAAHAKSITHRDLKPANILVTKSAGVKLLDFGLAKIGKPVSVGEDDDTVTMALTGKGTILGTLLYMSPEQIHGQEADARSDIFSFGLVLYEMITGKRAFEGSSPASVMAAILERPAPSIIDVAPAALNRVLKRCLEKDPENRWQSARDLRAALELVSPEPSLQIAAPAPPVRSTRVYALAGLSFLAIAAAVALSVIHFREAPAVQPVRRFQVLPEEGQKFAGVFSLSPDGMNLAYLAEDVSGKRQVFVRPLNSLDAKPVAEGRANTLFYWSPDNRGIIQGRQQANIDGTVEEHTLPGWMNPLRALPNPHPILLPDGKHAVFHQNNGIYLQSSDGGQPKLLKADVGQTNFEFSSIQGAGGDGYLLFVIDSSLMAQRLDVKRLELTGDLLTVVSGVARAGAGVGYFAGSQDGTLAYRAGSRTRVTVLLDRQSKEVAVFPGASGSVTLSPDGTKAAITRPVPTGDALILMLIDLQRHTEEQFTFGVSRSANPVWSPESTRIAFSSDPVGKAASNDSKVYVKPSNGSHAEELLYEWSGGVYPNSWSRDGKYIVLSQKDPKTGWDLWILNVAEKKATPFLQEPFDQIRGEISPDGRWMVYKSTESGTPGVYLRSFPDGKGKWLVASGEIDEPRWSHDGRTLYYRRGTMYAVSITSGAVPQFGTPEPVFDYRGPAPGASQNSYWDIAPDGQHFVTTAFPPETYSAPITLVLNWQAALKK